MRGFESSHRDIRAHRDEPETARDVVFSSSYNVAFAPHCAISHREIPSGGKAMHGRAPPRFTRLDSVGKQEDSMKATPRRLSVAPMMDRGY